MPEDPPGGAAPPRAVRADDVARLAVVHGASFPPAEAWGAAALALMLEMPGTWGHALGDDGFVLARSAADEAEILTLAVRPDRRRAGLGAALLGAALVRAMAGGVARVFLEVAEDNRAARALYASAGFSMAGRRRNYYGTGCDALVLRLDLPAADGAGGRVSPGAAKAS